MSLIFRRHWTRQPQTRTLLNSAFSDALLAFVPSMHGKNADLTGKPLSAISGGLVTRASSGGIGQWGKDDFGLSLTTAIATPSAATLISIQTANSASNTTSGWHKFDADSGESHFPYTTLWYTSTFSSARWLNGVAISSDITVPHVAVITGQGTNRAAYINGKLIGSSASAGAMNLGTTQKIGVSSSWWFKGDTFALILLPRELSATQIATQFASPGLAWANLFAPQPRRLWAPSAAAGPVTHATSGALAGGASTVAGTAVHRAKHATTGALAGGAASIAGVATRKAAHPTSGALTGGAAAVSGVAARTRAHPASGVLAGAGAVTAGTAAHKIPHPTTGALAGGGAAIAGTAARSSPGAHATSGALTGGGGVIAGTSAHIAVHATSGTLAGTGSVIEGVAARIGAAVTHSTSGSLVGTGAAVTGTAARASAAGSGATAAEIWGYVMANGLTAEANVLRILKLLQNTQISNPITGKYTVYDDDDITPLLEGDLFEDVNGTIRYRDQGANRRNRLT